MQTLANLHSLGTLRRDKLIFDERHARRETPPQCTINDVIAVYRALDLIDAPWPKRDQAGHEVSIIQTCLDRTLTD